MGWEGREEGGKRVGRRLTSEHKVPAHLPGATWAVAEAPPFRQRLLIVEDFSWKVRGLGGVGGVGGG